MMRRHWSGVGAILLALFVQLPWAATALADEEPLAQVPADAPIVIQIHGVQRTKERLLTMIKNALPELGTRMQAKVVAVRHQQSEENFARALEQLRTSSKTSNGREDVNIRGSSYYYCTTTETTKDGMPIFRPVSSA